MACWGSASGYCADARLTALHFNGDYLWCGACIALAIVDATA
ncbi:MAG: hypothetical protein ACR5LD_08480 [Symbiopectobacterium sp.]